MLEKILLGTMQHGPKTVYLYHNTTPHLVCMFKVLFFIFYVLFFYFYFFWYKAI
jgi:hypothetical protein